ncbi:MAG: GIY-YIG nuclease family protein [Bacteroidota bacterium]|nr:GIY-YIG nuclease family protein [Bacteroidota bacterium]
MFQDPEKRLIEHNSGKAKSTKGFTPWKIFFSEIFETRTKSREREIFLQAGSGKEKIKALWAKSLSGNTF